jgi:hypothetical protein
LSKLRQELAAQGTQLAFIHMGDESQGDCFFAQYGMTDVPRISDPSGEIYRSFGLRRFTIASMLTGFVWKRGMEGFKKGHGVGMAVGDTLRGGGVFLLKDGKIVAERRLNSVAERPDYSSMGKV